VLQGVGGGMMTPVGLAMLFRAFPSDERVRASAILIVPTTLAPALGPIIGGLLVTDLSWRWVFYVNVPLGILALGFGVLFLDGGETQQPGPFDTAGFLLSGAGLGLLMYGLSEGPIRHWTSGAVLFSIFFRRSSAGRAGGHRTAHAAATDRPAAAVQPVVPVL
jgi:MFS family permease